MITKKTRDDIIDQAKKLGCDWDGDVIVYKGQWYYVDILNHRVTKLKPKKLKYKEN